MGPIDPPQHKGCLPQYTRDKLVELQDQLDQLEEFGVFQHPEEIDITEYLNPSFLVKKTNGGSHLMMLAATVSLSRPCSLMKTLLSDKLHNGSTLSSQI